MKIKTILLAAAGFILLLFGAIGLLLPVWPTTPFVLGAAGCFAGSPRLRSVLLRNRFFGEYIENYQNQNGLSKKTVAGSLLFLWGMMAISCIAMRELWVTLLLISIGAAVTAHILWIARPNRKSDKK